jgi:hypothetical protein
MTTFVDSDLFQQLIVLHDVAGHLPKLTQVPVFVVDLDVPTHAF